MNEYNKLDAIKGFESFNNLYRCPDNSSDYEKLCSATKFWFYQPKEETVKKISFLCNRELQADSGSSGFNPPEGMIGEIKKFSEEEASNYGPIIINDDKTIKKVAKYCRHYKITKKNINFSINSQHDKPNENNLYILPGAGTTPLYNLAVKILIKNPNDLFLVPVPTYGLFMSPIFENKGQVIPIPLNKENNFKISEDKLRIIIQEKENEIINNYIEYIEETPTHEKILKIISNKKQEKKPSIKSINKEIKKINREIEATEKYKKTNQSFKDRLLIPLLNRIRCFLNINPHTPLGLVFTQTEIEAIKKVLVDFGISVIDDLTHININYKDQEVGTFLKKSTGNKKDFDYSKVITLVSFSKDFALANLKAGFALTGQKTAKKMMASLLSTYGSCSIITKKTIDKVTFSTKKLDEYLNKNNIEYLKRRNLIISIISGFDSITDEAIKNSATKSLNKVFKKIEKKEELKKNINEWRQKLTEGFKDVKLVFQANAGLFVLLDFSSVKGKFLGNVKIEKSMDIRNALYFIGDLNTIPSEMLFHFNSNDLYLRFSLSLNELEICEAMLRIKEILNLMTAPPPSQASICTSTSTSTSSTTIIDLENEVENNLLSLKRKESLTLSQKEKIDESIEQKKRKKELKQQPISLSTTTTSPSSFYSSAPINQKKAATVPLQPFPLQPIPLQPVPLPLQPIPLQPVLLQPGIPPQHFYLQPIPPQPVRLRPLQIKSPQPCFSSDTIEFQEENIIKSTYLKGETFEIIKNKISSILKTKSNKEFDLLLIDNGSYYKFDQKTFNECYLANQDKEKWDLRFFVQYIDT